MIIKMREVYDTTIGRTEILFDGGLELFFSLDAGVVKSFECTFILR